MVHGAFVRIMVGRGCSSCDVHSVLLPTMRGNGSGKFHLDRYNHHDFHMDLLRMVFAFVRMLFHCSLDCNDICIRFWLIRIGRIHMVLTHTLSRRKKDLQVIKIHISNTTLKLSLSLIRRKEFDIK